MKKYKMTELHEIRFTKSSAPFGWMGNMSRCKIFFEEQEWQSTEALFQALRFPEDSPIREEIRLAKNGYEAKQVAKLNRTKMSVVPTSEEDLDNMRLCIALKIEQHKELRDILIGSKGIPIYEDVTKRGEGNSNLIWGAIKQDDGTWKGDNIMGELWVELREKLLMQNSTKMGFDEPKVEIETERRFLLKSLPSHVRWDDIIEISQTYISEKNANIVERVRNSFSLNLEFDIWTHTTKDRLTDMSVNEVEREIGVDEYNKFIDMGKRSINKRRNIKKVDNLKWEIDVFSNLVIAEIELPSEDYNLVIPDWLKPHIIMEITGMHQFSNSNLAI